MAAMSVSSERCVGLVLNWGRCMHVWCVYMAAPLPLWLHVFDLVKAAAWLFVHNHNCSVGSSCTPISCVLVAGLSWAGAPDVDALQSQERASHKYLGASCAHGSATTGPQHDTTHDGHDLAQMCQQTKSVLLCSRHAPVHTGPAGRVQRVVADRASASAAPQAHIPTIWLCITSHTRLPHPACTLTNTRCTWAGRRG